MNTQAIVLILVFLLVSYGLYRQVKEFLIESVNGFTIHQINDVYEVRKGKEARAQFVTHKSAVLYCNTH